MYGLASGAMERTSTRAERSLPRGMRTMEPRSMAEALIWLGASKWGSRRRYELTLELSTRQRSVALARMRLMKSQPAAERPSLPSFS
jgi:hypothetical protein